ncbi:MAG: hypothetical protein JRN07_02660 [Nitrososphaerota archaeon]|nr:hypothetical protein [Nitrososphaerota archaeon]
MARKGVAATMAAVALLTLLVVADATLVVAAGDLASESQAAQLEARALLVERSYGGLVSFQALSQVEGRLASSPAYCGSLPAYLGSISAEAASRGVDSGVGYLADASLSLDRGSSQAVVADNLTSLAPFSGYVPGELDLSESLAVSESGGGGAVLLDKRESHTLHLPIGVAEAGSLCESATGSLAATLSRWPCNASLEAASFDSALAAAAAQAWAEGFRLTAGWGADGSCKAAYWVTLVEPGVPGPAGRFDWTVLGSGTAG